MIALQRSEYLRAMFMAEVRLYRRDQFVWIDESGCDAQSLICSDRVLALTSTIDTYYKCRYFLRFCAGRANT